VAEDISSETLGIIANYIAKPRLSAEVKQQAEQSKPWPFRGEKKHIRQTLTGASNELTIT
jgi:hypothetical protein